MIFGKQLMNQSTRNQNAMKKEEVLEIIHAHQTQLQELGVKSLNLFGSVAREQAKPESDVDFLVEFSKPIGFFEFFRVQHYLEDILGCQVDLGTFDALKEHLRKPVLEEVIRVL